MRLSRMGPIVLAVALLLAGCSHAYEAERRLWRVERRNRAVLEKPAAATPEAVQRAVAELRAVEEFSRGTPSGARIGLMIGAVRQARGEADAAREAYRSVVQLYPDQRAAAAEALVRIGRSLEAESRWDEAIAAYADLAERFPWSSIGLEAPLYIADLTERAGRPPEARREAYARAVAGYRAMADRPPVPELKPIVQRHLLVTLEKAQQWPEAAELLAAMIESGPASARPALLYELGALSALKLKDVEKAKAAFGRLVQEAPETPMGRSAAKQLERLAQGLPVGEP